MAFHVIDAVEGLPGGGGEAFGVSESNVERGSQAGAAGGSEGVDLVEGDSGVDDRVLDQGADALGLVAAGDFRDHAAILSVDLDLRGNE